MAEQLGQEQRLDERGAVDGDHRAAGAVAGAVERRGDELLARPALAANEHGAARSRDLLMVARRAHIAGVVADELEGRAGDGTGSARRVGRGPRARGPRDRRSRRSVRIGGRGLREEHLEAGHAGDVAPGDEDGADVRGQAHRDLIAEKGRLREVRARGRELATGAVGLAAAAGEPPAAAPPRRPSARARAPRPRAPRRLPPRHARSEPRARRPRHALRPWP